MEYDTKGTVAHQRHVEMKRGLLKIAFQIEEMRMEIVKLRAEIEVMREVTERRNVSIPYRGTIS